MSYTPFRQIARVNLLAKLLEIPGSPPGLQKDAVCPQTLALGGRTRGQIRKQNLALLRENAFSILLSSSSQKRCRRLNRFSRKSFMYGLAWALLIGSLWATSAFAHDGELFRDEIGKIEKLFTGGYMRIGLLGVCGMTAVTGAVKQNAWMFLSGILAGIFAFFMRDWVLTTFAYLI